MGLDTARSWVGGNLFFIFLYAMPGLYLDGHEKVKGDSIGYVHEQRCDSDS